MRVLPVIVTLGILVTGSAASAQEPRASLQAFGGLGLGGVSSTNATYGGQMSGHLTSNVQLFGGAGRLGNVLPSTTQTLVGLSPVGLSVGAWYGEGGVRVGAGSSPVRPYAEVSAGIARLRPELTGLGGVPSAIANAGLSLLDTTAPLASVGGGVTFEGGPLLLDVGYRHRQLFSSSWMDALALGRGLGTNEVRVGIGVRF